VTQAGTPQVEPEQAIEQPSPRRELQLSRAETVSAPIGLNLAIGRGREGEEPPLSIDQLKGMQSSGILDLVSQLRTQRRLFG
jgi:hypothetical protein